LSEGDGSGVLQRKAAGRDCSQWPRAAPREDAAKANAPHAGAPRCAGLRPLCPQLDALSAIHEWWARASDALHEARRGVNAAAAAAPEDASLQGEVLQELCRLQRGFICDLAAGLLVQLACVLQPLQIARVYMHCWPRMPLFSALLSAYSRRREAVATGAVRAASAAAPVLAAPLQRGAGAASA
jgi:hypothetical protein